MKIHEATLKALMIASLRGDGDAYQSLVSACADRLDRYYRRHLPGRETDIEDLVQDTLFAIHRRRESYDCALPFAAWLNKIARYKLADYSRRTGVRVSLALDDALDAVIDDCNGAVSARLDIERLLARLPAKQAAAIRLTRIEGLSVFEAARSSGQSEPSIKVGVHRGMRRLMASIKGSRR